MGMFAAGVAYMSTRRCMHRPQPARVYVVFFGVVPCVRGCYYGAYGYVAYDMSTASYAVLTVLAYVSCVRAFVFMYSMTRRAVCVCAISVCVAEAEASVRVRAV